MILGKASCAAAVAVALLSEPATACSRSRSAFLFFDEGSATLDETRWTQFRRTMPADGRSFTIILTGRIDHGESAAGLSRLDAQRIEAVEAAFRREAVAPIVRARRNAGVREPVVATQSSEPQNRAVSLTWDFSRDVIWTWENDPTRPSSFCPVGRAALADGTDCGWF